MSSELPLPITTRIGTRNGQQTVLCNNTGDTSYDAEGKDTGVLQKFNNVEGLT